MKAKSFTRKRAFRSIATGYCLKILDARSPKEPETSCAGRTDNPSHLRDREEDKPSRFAHFLDSAALHRGYFSKIFASIFPFHRF